MSIRPLAPRALAAAVITALLACGPTRPAGQAPASTTPANDAAPGDSSGGSIATMLMKKFPGVIITQESGGLRILLRGGGGSFYNGSEPLYVVDEVPLPEGSGGLVMVSANDIEKIQVLKNPPDIAMYGMRGSNGVVKITTKHAH